MTKDYRNPPPPENYTKPKPPPCPPAPPSREFICNMFGFVESKESISKREEYVKNKDKGIPYDIIGSSGIMVADAEDVRKHAKRQFDKCNEYFNNQQESVMNNSAIKQLFKFYGIEYDEYCYDLYAYIANLEQLVNIQAQQIERLQLRLQEVEPQKPMNEHHKIRID